MKNLIRFTLYTVSAFILISVLLAGVKTKSARVSLSAKDLPKVEVTGQLAQSLELFQKGYSRYLFSAGPTEDLRPFILNTVTQSLPKQFRNKAFEIARAVIVEANHHQMDPLFLLAVIQTESEFNLNARGSSGEIGLMQILPATAAWLAPQAGVEEGFNLEDPAVNVRIGATYFAQLRKNFDNKGNRYVAAYNMGPGNVRRLVASKTEPHIYPGKVIRNYKTFYKSLDRATASASTGRAIASVQEF